MTPVVEKALAEFHAAPAKEQEELATTLLDVMQRRRLSYHHAAKQSDTVDRHAQIDRHAVQKLTRRFRGHLVEGETLAGFNDEFYDEFGLPK